MKADLSKLRFEDADHEAAHPFTVLRGEGDYEDVEVVVRFYGAGVENTAAVASLLAAAPTLLAVVHTFEAWLRRDPDVLERIAEEAVADERNPGEEYTQEYLGRLAETAIALALEAPSP